MKFDDLVVNYLGEFGTYQKIKFLLVCLPTMITAMHALSWTFIAGPMDYRCRLPEEPKNAPYWIGNSSSLLLTKDCNLKKERFRTHCPYLECNLTDSSTCPNGYIFDYSVIKRSAIERWEIVCDKSFLKPTIQSSYYAGQFFGSLLFGFLGDRIGRKKVFFIAIIMQMIAGGGMVFAPHWVFYMMFRAMVGFAHPGIFAIAVVIGMELVGPKKRKIASVYTGIFFSIGQTILGVLSYYIRDYQHLQAAIVIPTFVFLSYWWIIPESARWLVSQKRFAEADAILQRVARANKTNLPPNWWEEVGLDKIENEKKSLVKTDISSSETPELRSESPTGSVQNVLEKSRKHNFLDLIRTPTIRKISFTSFFCWPVISMIYYGISMSPNFLGGDLYVNFIFGALMEIPAVLVVYLVVDKIGRKPLLSGGSLIFSLAILSSLFIDDNVHWLISLIQYLIAKAAITATYSVLYTFTPELFPTVIRNMAMGVCSMMARVGASSSSFIAMGREDRFDKALMVISFSTLGIMAAIVSMIFLPETNGKTLPETVEEAEGFVKKDELEHLSSKSKSPIKTQSDE